MITILVVDDSLAVRTLVARFVQQAGITNASVREAASVTEARAAMREAPPDVVFVDVMLPDYSGVQLVGEIVARDANARVVLVTAYAREHESVLNALSLGARAYLRKPFTLADFVTACEAADLPVARAVPLDAGDTKRRPFRGLPPT